MRGPENERQPEAYYVQYRVVFNPNQGGQEGIICLSEIQLNYEYGLPLIFLPLTAR